MPEREPRERKKERIQLRQEFIVFDPKRTFVGIDHNFLAVSQMLWEHYGNTGSSPDTHTTIETKRLLQIPQLNLSVPVKFENMEFDQPDSGFTPFDPDYGYQVTDDDSDEVDYLKKIAAYKPPADLLQRFPFVLSIVAGDSNEEFPWQRKRFSLRRRITDEEIIEELSKLRFQAAFPNSLTYEAAGVWGPQIDSFGGLGFWEFYQLGNSEPARNSTHSLRLPKDVNDLMEIKGKFFLEE